MNQHFLTYPILLTIALIATLATASMQLYALSPPLDEYPVIRYSRSGDIVAKIDWRYAASPAQSTYPFLIGRIPKYKTRQSKVNKILCRGNFPYSPEGHIAFVLSDGSGIVDIGRWVSFHANPNLRLQEYALLFVSCDGAVKTNVLVGNLISKTVMRESPRDSSTGMRLWFSAYWLDSKERYVYFLLPSRKVRRIEIASGTISGGKLADLISALNYTKGRNRRWLLETAIEFNLPEIDKITLRIAQNKKEGLEYRLRAAYFQRDNLSKKMLRKLFLDAAQHGKAPGNTVADRRYATERLPEFLEPNEALAVLQASMNDSEIWGSAMRAFNKMGEGAVPTLISMLKDQKASADYSGAAAHCLGDIASQKAVEALSEAVLDPREYVANAAVNALIKIAPEDLTQRLQMLLKHNTSQDGRIRRYLKEKQNKL